MHTNAQEYDKPTITNDIAVMTLRDPVSLGPEVKAVRRACLPNPNTDYLHNHTCTVTGWGALSEGHTHPLILMHFYIQSS